MGIESVRERGAEIDPHKLRFVTARTDRTPDQIPGTDFPDNGTGWDGWLVVEWLHFFAGTQHSERDPVQLRKFFGSQLSRGIPPEEIRDRIRDPSRVTSEPTWEFDKFWTEKVRKKTISQQMDEAFKRGRK